MKIVQLNNFITLNGGSETVMQNLTTLLEKKGHAVRNIGFHSLHNDQVMTNAISLGKEQYSVKKFFWNSKLVTRVVELVNEWQAELVICHNVYHKYPMADLLKSLKERTRAKLGIVFHDYKAVCPRCNLYTGKQVCTACTHGKFYKIAVNRCRNNSFIYSGILAVDSYFNNSWKKAYSYPDFFISPSRFLASQMSTMGFKYPIHVLPNPINTDLLTQQKAKTDTYHRSILYAARLTRDKGLENYMALAASFPSLTFYVAGGSGELQDKLKEMEKQHSNLKYLGSLAQPDLFEMFQKVDYLMLPSIWYENNPMIIIEAMNFGLPVIGSRIGGIPELLEDNRGFLFDPYKPGDAEDLLQKLQELPRDIYDEVAERAKKFARQLSFDHYYERLSSVLPQLNEQVADHN